MLFVPTQNNSRPESFSFLSFYCTDGSVQSCDRTSFSLAIFVWPPLSFSLLYFHPLPFPISTALAPFPPLKVSDRVGLHSAGSWLFVPPCAADHSSGPGRSLLLPWDVRAHLCGWRAGLALAQWPHWPPWGRGEAGRGTVGLRWGGWVPACCLWVKWRRAPSSTAKL